jgi:hypothetical protein
MDTRCHQYSFCFIKNEVEAWKIASHVSRELNILEDISVVLMVKLYIKHRHGDTGPQSQHLEGRARKIMSLRPD